MDQENILNTDLYRDISECFGINEKDIRTYSPLALAFIGDCVYDMVIRSMLVAGGNTSNDKLHRRKAAIVKASAQAELIEEIMGELTEEEMDIYKRGRNAHTNSRAKNATDSDYHKATGFEALLGYLYMTHRMDRVLTLVRSGLQHSSK